MPTLNSLFNLYNFPPIIFVYWDISFNYPLNELELNEQGVALKNGESYNIFDEYFPKDYQYYYPHVINIDININLDENKNLRDIAEKYYLNIIKDNQYNKNEINYIIENYFIFNLEIYH